MTMKMEHPGRRAISPVPEEERQRFQPNSHSELELSQQRIACSFNFFYVTE